MRRAKSICRDSAGRRVGKRWIKTESKTRSELSQKLFSKGRDAVFLGLLLGLTAALYAPFCSNPFAYDDFLVIADNDFIANPRNIPKLFAGTYFENAAENSYRPLVTFSYFLDNLIWGKEAFGYHFTNLALHLVAVSLFFVLIRRIRPGVPEVRWFAASAYAFHPILSETVLNASHREWLLAGVFLYAAMGRFLQYLDAPNGLRSLLWSAAFFVLALLSHEACAAAPIVLTALCVFRSGSKDNSALFTRLCGALKKTLPFWIMGVAWAVARLTFLAQAGTSPPPFPGGSRLGALLTAGPLILSYLKTALLPFGLSAVYDPYSASPQAAWWSFAAWGLLVVAGVFSARRLRESGAVLGFIWAGAMLLPALHFVVPFWHFRADRFASLSLGGLCLVPVLLARSGVGRRRFGWVFVILGIIVPAFFALQTYRRGLIWSDSTRLWSDALAKAPQAPRVRYNLAVALAQNKGFAEAIPHARALIADHPGEAKNTLLLSRLLLGAGRAEAGLAVLEGFRKDFSGSSEITRAYAEALLDLHRHQEAVEAYENLQHSGHAGPRDIYQLGGLYLQSSLIHRAFDLARILSRSHPDSPYSLLLGAHLLLLQEDIPNARRTALQALRASKPGGEAENLARRFLKNQKMKYHEATQK